MQGYAVAFALARLLPDVRRQYVTRSVDRTANRRPSSRSCYRTRSWLYPLPVHRSTRRVFVPPPPVVVIGPARAGFFFGRTSFSARV